MKVNKKQGLLFIYNLLKDGEHISKEEIMKELDISENSVWKYFQEIRAFIANFFLPYEIKYNRSSKSYYLLEIKE